MMQQGPQMTATEVIQRNEEKMRLLGPVLGRLQSELLKPSAVAKVSLQTLLSDYTGQVIDIRK